MYLYHGSPRKFDRFDIRKCSNNPSLKEGKGIYMTDKANIKVAKSYGKYLYTIDVPDSKILDFTKKAQISSFIKKVTKGINILDNSTINNIVNAMYNSDVAIYDDTPEICKVLDNCEKLYNLYPDKADEIVEKVRKTYFDILSKYQAIKYIDRELGKVYFSRQNVEKLTITTCEAQY